jgi:hypothetical protein
MPTSSNYRNDSGATALEAPSPTHERILRVLGMTHRPLRSAELEGALGLVEDESRSACRWLTDHGYITSTVCFGKAPARGNSLPVWSLAAKGRTWARHQGALAS